MRTLTDDEVRKWVDSHVTFERWLRAVHAERAVTVPPPGVAGTPADVHDDRGAQPKRTWRWLRRAVGGTRRAMNGGEPVTAPQLVNIGTPRKECEAHDPKRAA